MKHIGSYLIERELVRSRAADKRGESEATLAPNRRYWRNMEVNAIDDFC